MNLQVSAIVPVFNAKRYVEAALRSIQNQTHPVAEIIVVDDGSTDESANTISNCGIAVNMIKQANAGAARARNTGMQHAQFPWIAFLDADDVWEPTKIEQQAAVVKTAENVACVHTGHYLFDDEKRISEHLVQPESTEIQDLLLDPLVNTSTAMIRNGTATQFPEYAGKGGDGEDMIFFAELRRHGAFEYIREPLAGYRMHSGQTTKTIGSGVRHFRNRFRWVEESVASHDRKLAELLRAQLRNQVLYWIDLAKWKRDWREHAALVRYAASLEWPDGRPEKLSERLRPKFAYHFKDGLDKAISGIQFLRKH